MWNEFMLHYFLTGLMLGSIAMLDGVRPEHVRSDATRSALMLFGIWCVATILIQRNILQLMSDEFGLEVADDMVLVALLVVTLRKLRPLGFCEREHSDDQMDA